MIRMTPDQSEAFTRLRHTEVLNYCQLSLQDCQDQLVTQVDHDVLRRLQGQAQVYKHLIQSILLTGKQGSLP